MGIHLMTGVLRKQGRFGDRHTDRGWPCDSGVRDRSDAAHKPRDAKDGHSRQELGEARKSHWACGGSVAWPTH